MEDQNPPTPAANDAAPAVAPRVEEQPQGSPGALRPMWPVKGPGAGAGVWRRYALAARLLATACALLAFYVSWAPLATAITSGDLSQGPTGPLYRFGLTAAELGAPPLHALFGADFFGPWSALTVLGLLISPLLWQTTFRWLRWLAVALYGCWLVAIMIVFAETAQLILSALPDQLHAGAGPYTTTLYPYTTHVAIYSISPAFGLWLVIVTALLGLAAAACAALSAVRYQQARVPVAPSVQGEIVTHAGRPTRSLPGSGAITGGLLLWAWGFFLLPWATVNCTQSPLLLGTCRGLPVTSALQIGLGNARAFFDPSAGLVAITGLLLVGALSILLAVWRRDITRTLCSWATAWLALALGSAAVAVAGAQQAVSDAPSVGLPTGDWRGDSGVLIVFLALLLVAIGLIPLWAVAVRTMQRRAAQHHPQGV